MKIDNDFLKAFEQVDLIASPTSPTAAFKIGEKANDPLQIIYQPSVAREPALASAGEVARLASP